MPETIDELKKRVLDANLLLPLHGLVTFTWGNASGIDPERKLVAIKPSGVEYEGMTADMMALVEAETGKTVAGSLAPSSDAATHLALYRAFPEIGGIVHTHSRWATIFAQAGMRIPPLGTTHADYFHGEIPCTRKMAREEIENDYEANTGAVIVERFGAGLDPARMPAVLVNGHAPFVWGKDPGEAVHNAVVLEEIAFMAYHSMMLDPKIEDMQRELLDKHFMRKHGPGAYYGQR